MTDTVRRVVTTHDPAGKTVLLSDDRVTLADFPGGKAKGAVLWTTGTVPADTIGDVEGDKRPAGMSVKGGSVLRITEFGPGFVSPMHRTLSIDYAVVLSGALELILDGGERVTLRPGDAAIQRGTNHAWRNPSRDQSCRIMVAMIEAHPIAIAGKRLGQTPAWRMVASVLRSALTRASKAHDAAPATGEARPSNPMEIRRIVTGHDPSGKAVVLSEQVVGLSRESGGVSSAVLWSTGQVPADDADRNSETMPPDSRLSRP